MKFSYLLQAAYLKQQQWLRGQCMDSRIEYDMQPEKQFTFSPSILQAALAGDDKDMWEREVYYFKA